MEEEARVVMTSTRVTVKGENVVMLNNSEFQSAREGREKKNERSDHQIEASQQRAHLLVLPVVVQVPDQI